MNLKEFAGVDSYNRDLRTGRELEWHEYMGRVIERLGIKNIEPYIPFDIETVREMLEYDEHLNNLPFESYARETIRKWDYAASYMNNLLVRNGITTFSLSEKVCILKEAARILCKGKEN